VTENSVGVGLVIPVPGKKVLERCSGLFHEKQLPGNGVLAHSITKVPLVTGTCYMP
jgi:hypothetical protein